ncbi:transcriptional regulator, TetR family [Myxococcus xanthus DK 1622]|uniref:Transcriptional regulator, TetR family n=1 Tax=Myxococcus xanthus (strain DK1622) TaxID=246197 RepID=Q1DE29_MYXXD|nr:MULTISPECIES: TetR/AcrR family transcriptional regulator [Myxococcus]ABF91391.1 transcriptional regulator, TetR family [Myxococcus xanthus DK 1622]NOJ57054.1 TetR family transcriptional regulator [Myxococcus xanthus]QPM80501.1 TetR family transcriptional regulator C-terminal domain-containing protein [Myxococcus xanthus]QVW69562.1 TetR family transcriptional regulator C-terminal domain-containing protein [Myxococcus xanthus DZ2]QZZ48364.1 HTH-type transcriptional regulator BetI [Myxococcus 
MPRATRGKLPSSKPREGTAVHAKGTERVASILDAATDTLVEEGHSGLTLRRVAQRAGLSVGNLQYYFPAKQDVVRALLARYLEAASQRVHARVEEGGRAPMERLRRAVEALLEDQESPRHCQLFAELWALAARDEMVADALAVFYAGFRAGVVALLRELAPGLSPSRLERRAALVVAFLEGLSLFRGGGALRRASVPGLEQELRAVLEEVLAGVPAAGKL